MQQDAMMLTEFFDRFGTDEACCRQKKRVRFWGAVDLVNLLEQEKLSGKGGRTAEHLCRFDCVIVDELWYLPFSRNG